MRFERQVVIRNPYTTKLSITAIGLKLLFMFAPVLKDISKGWTLIIIMITASSIYALRHYKEESEKETVENE